MTGYFATLLKEGLKGTISKGTILMIALLGIASTMITAYWIWIKNATDKFPMDNYMIPVYFWVFTAFVAIILLIRDYKINNKKNNNDQRLSILNLELENRFRSFLNHIEKPNKNWGVFKTFIVASENILNGRCNAYVSKDFKMTPTLQLLLELKDITKNEDKLNDISDAITGIRKLSKIILPGWGDTKMNATPENNRIKIQNEILLIIKTSNFSKWC